MAKKLSELDELEILESRVCQKGIQLPRVEVKQVMCFNVGKGGSGGMLASKHHITCYWQDGYAFIGIVEDGVQVLWAVLRYLDSFGDKAYTKSKAAAKVYASLGDSVRLEMPHYDQPKVSA